MLEEFFYVLYRYLDDLSNDISSQFKEFNNKCIKSIKQEAQLKSLYEELINNEKYEVKEENEIYKLKSIFSIVNSNDKQLKIGDNKLICRDLKVEALSNEFVFPVKDETIDKVNFVKHIESFINEMKTCSKDEQKLYLFRKYFSCIPVKNSSKCYVSLFTAGKILSAVYSCLKSEEFKGEYKGNKLCLVKADISGIQDFIFSISSKEAAKSLKGRSVYISLITDIISKYIVRKLELSQNNILYNGGGNFYIVIPDSRRNDIYTIRKYISKLFLRAHKGKIYVAIETSKKLINIESLKDASVFFDNVSQEVAALKNKKWSDINIEENFDSIFGPIDNYNNGKKVCSICGSVLEDSEEEMCSMCKSFAQLTDEIKKAKFYCEEEIEESNIPDIKTYKDIFKCLGFKIQFKKDSLGNGKKYLINGTDFLQYGCDGYLFKALRLPEESTFENIVSINSREDKVGDKKLGVLKLDVDNLGKIFIKGLKFEENDKVSMGKIIELSNSIALFFEGYLNSLIGNEEEKALFMKNGKVRGKNWSRVLYTVYAGGDDTFILGAYNEVFEFAYILRKSFERYVCNNKSVTFSAGLGLFPYKYPVIKCANYTESFLDTAKVYMRRNEDLPRKNSVCLFGEVFTWDEFEKILEIRNLCIDICKESKKRAFLQKILNSTKGFKSIMSDISTRKKIEIVKVHRLAYYLRDLKNNKNQISDKVEKLVNTYEEMIVGSILSKFNSTCNIMVIPAAVRWAELNTKNTGESDE